MSLTSQDLLRGAEFSPSAQKPRPPPLFLVPITLGPPLAVVALALAQPILRRRLVAAGTEQQRRRPAYQHAYSYLTPAEFLSAGELQEGDYNVPPRPRGWLPVSRAHFGRESEQLCARRIIVIVSNTAYLCAFRRFPPAITCIFGRNAPICDLARSSHSPLPAHLPIRPPERCSGVDIHPNTNVSAAHTLILSTVRAAVLAMFHVEPMSERAWNGAFGSNFGLQA